MCWKNNWNFCVCMKLEKSTVCSGATFAGLRVLGLYRRHIAAQKKRHLVAVNIIYITFKRQKSQLEMNNKKTILKPVATDATPKCQIM